VAGCVPLARSPDQKYNSLGNPHVALRGHIAFNSHGANLLTAFPAFRLLISSVDPSQLCTYCTRPSRKCQAENALYLNFFLSVTYIPHIVGSSFLSPVILMTDYHMLCFNIYLQGSAYPVYTHMGAMSSTFFRNRRTIMHLVGSGGGCQQTSVVRTIELHYAILGV